MKRIFLTAGALALAFSTSTTLATSTALAAPATDSGFYAGVTLGYSNTDIDGEIGGPSVGGTFGGNSDVKGADIGILAGYRHVFENAFFVGAEADFTFSGADSSDAFGIPGLEVEKKHAFGLYLKPGYRFNDRLSAFATLGWKWNEYEMKVAGVSDDDRYNGFTYGGGVEYALNDTLSLAGEYNRVNLGSKHYDLGGGNYTYYNGDENIVKLALKYHF